MEYKRAYGVDLGWLSQLESQGIKWVDQDKKETDPIEGVKNMGADSVRLRIFVNPPKDGYWMKGGVTSCMLGFCDAESVLKVSERVHKAGMRLMIDFHYSDHFADPEYQDIPEEWKEDSAKQLSGRIYQHTKDVLGLLTRHGITPEWVQVGNEINQGMLWPIGRREKNPEHMVTFFNAGYEAVKECCPNSQVIAHISGVSHREYCDPFLETFFSLGGKTDILGFSYYPFWYDALDEKKEKKPAALFYNPLTYYAEKYGKPVMICEVGGPETDAEGTYQLLINTMEAVRQVPDHMGLGIFYWEPEVGAAVLPDSYPLGAAIALDQTTIQFTKALSAYRDFGKRYE